MNFPPVNMQSPVTKQIRLVFRMFTQI